MPEIEPPPPKAQRLLEVIVEQIKSGRIRENQPESFLAFSEALELLGDATPSVMSGSRLTSLGLGDLHTWTEDHEGLPKITGLIVYKESRRPHEDFPKWHGHENDPEWEKWWLKEANRAIKYDWSRFLDAPKLEETRVREEPHIGKQAALNQRITFDPAVMGGRPCIRGMRVTVGTIVGLLASGHSRSKVLELYPYLEPEDIDAALSFAAWRAEERELPLSHA
jgi:uncharacterized protein (DUF433 family)